MADENNVPKQNKPVEQCRFFSTPRGCRFGLQCRFRHIAQGPEQNITATGNPSTSSNAVEPKRRNPKPRVPFSKPTSKTEIKVANASPEEKCKALMLQEIDQLEKRFKIYPDFLITNGDSEKQVTSVTLNMPITDPEFPFDLQFLKLNIAVPPGYPGLDQSAFCKFSVINDNIPDNMKEYVSSTVNRISEQASSKSTEPIIKMILNWLDKNLEALLRKAMEIQTSTVKIVKKVAVEHKAKAEEEMPESSENEEYEDEEEHEYEHEENSDIAEESEYEEEGAEEQSGGENGKSQSSLGGFTETNTILALPDVKFEKISLIEPCLISITVSCKRCQEQTDFNSLVPSSESVERRKCKKCKTEFAARFRPLQIFNPAEQAGIGSFDFLNCTPSDLLTSSFYVTCSDCIIPEDSAIKNNVMKNVLRGFTCRRDCFNCHAPMTLQINTALWQRAVRLMPRAQGKNGPIVPRIKKEDLKNLGIVPGKPLPENGVCKHYKRSFRWLRFPCCGKVYPCDVCHEEKKGDSHPMKEQKFQKEAECIECGKGVTSSSKGSMFWEGGKGTRDTSKMSRKDSHKFKGLGKTLSKKKVSSNK